MTAHVNAARSSAASVVDLCAWFFDPEGCHTRREMILQQSLHDYQAFAAIDMDSGRVIDATHRWMVGLNAMTHRAQDTSHSHLFGDHA